jgi:hypothetical protein
MDDLYYFYKTKVGFNQIIFKDIKKTYGAFLLLFIFSASLLMIVFPTRSTLLISVISLCTIACIILGYYLNNKAKATLITKYKNLYNKGSLGKFDYIGVFFWNNNLFKKIQKKLLKDYLEEQLDIDFSKDIDKIEKLIDLSYKKAERSKISLSLFKKVGILAAFTPIGARYFTLIYNKIDNFEIATNISLKIGFILIVLTIMLFCIEIIIDEFLNSKSLRYRNIGRLLEEISVDYIINET